MWRRRAFLFARSIAGLIRRKPFTSAWKERMMTILRNQNQKLYLFVDKSSQQWIVQEPDGTFWIIPATDDPWEDRQPFIPTEESELEPVPGHYKCMLGLPF
jgi:hypothetical protein